MKIRDVRPNSFVDNEMRVDDVRDSTYLGYTMSEATEVVEAAIEDAPGSIRELAREADLSPSTIRHARDGHRPLTPRTRDALADALRRWGERCRGAAVRLDDADVASDATRGEREESPR